jgi:hypothetical protein
LSLVAIIRRVRDAVCASASTWDTWRSPSVQWATSPLYGRRLTRAHSIGTKVLEIQRRH